jgi:hypothetical protein
MGQIINALIKISTIGSIKNHLIIKYINQYNLIYENSCNSTKNDRRRAFK